MKAIRQKLKSCQVRRYPVQNVDPEKWCLFLWDVAGSTSSIYMMKFGAHIPFSGKPFPNDPRKFPKLKK